MHMENIEILSDLYNYGTNNKGNTHGLVYISYVSTLKYVLESIFTWLNNDILLLSFLLSQCSSSKFLFCFFKIDLNGVALVATHNVEKSTSVRPSRQALLNKDFKQLSGIYDAVYNVKAGFFKCELNDKNINDLAEFILINGVRISSLETYGLC